MPIYQTVNIKNSQKVVKYHETREEATEYLRLQAAIDFYNKLPKHGSIETRAQAILDNVDALSIKLAEVDGEIVDWVRPKD